MNGYPLKTVHKELLRTLVEYYLAGKLDAEFAPIPAAGTPTQYTILLRQERNFFFKRISDLDLLCDVGYLAFRWNRQGTAKIYHLTKAGITAVQSDFEPASDSPKYDVNLAELMTTMSSGTVKIPELDESIDLLMVVQDPILRHTTVEMLINNLLQQMRFELSWQQFADYEKAARALRRELLTAVPDSQRLRQAAQSLSLLNGIENNMPTMLKSWVYLYPLLLIGNARLYEDGKK